MSSHLLLTPQSAGEVILSFTVKFVKAWSIFQVRLLSIRLALIPCHNAQQLNRLSKRKRGMASNPLFITPDFWLGEWIVTKYWFIRPHFISKALISGKDDHFVVKCLCCNEATPIRKAPAGKKYVRCPCNCLLIAKQKSVRISCPRLTGNKILIVNSERRRRTDEFSNWPGLTQVICAHCDDTFGFDIRNDCAARCPHCRKVSSVEQTMKIRAKYFFITAFALFLLTTGLTIGTYFIGDKELVTTCIFWLGLIFTVAVSLRGLYLYCLPQSSIENDV